MTTVVGQSPAPAGGSKSEQAYDQAIDLARKQIELNPRDAYARSRLAECLAKRGRIAEARKEIDAALDIDKTDGGTMFRAAIVSMLAGKDEEATKWLTRALQAGYDRYQIEHDPELAVLRQKPVFREVMQPSSTMATGPQ